MESFFSLFEPADARGQQTKKTRHKHEQDNAKKTADAPKGRRRGRRAPRSETLPEESSFLCEPELGGQPLAPAHCSYLEHHMEPRDDDTKTDSDKKPRRRNSGRKNRRKKNKISPAKDVSPGSAWADSADAPETLNNQHSVAKVCDEKLGKNVNDLKLDEEYKKTKRKDNVDHNDKDLDKKDGFANRVYNVIDKLEKVNIKEDMYLAGDFDAEDLESDFFYSSDDAEEFCSDSSDAAQSGDECYGRLPPEPRFGNVEYKLQLVAPGERRFQHLVTQLKWRLRSGGGRAVYVVGVRDCGALRGLRAGPLRASLRALRAMAAALGATVAGARARRVAPNRAVAEVFIRKLADTQQSVELRVAVMGANEAGKSTLIGVLTQGELDNGRGSARLNMFRHQHEVKSGRTSSLSHEILGFDAQGNVVNYGCSELMTAERIGERSAKLVSFLDLAGHSKYQRTTLHGLTGYSPHYAMLVISATAGITSITEEHVGLLLALDVPLFAVVTKCELAPLALPALLARLQQLLQPANRKPLLITDESLARSCVAPQKSILDAIDDSPSAKEDADAGSVPVFPVSCARGAGLNALHAYLLALQPPGDSVLHQPEDETCEFQIDEIFHVGESAGPVVGGLLARGTLREGDNLIIGPLESGEFVPVWVRTVHRNRVPCGAARAGHSASLGLRPAALALRPGMVLLAAPPPAPAAPAARTFGGCGPGPCKGRQITDIIQSSKSLEKNQKNARRQNKNILQDIANVHNNLTKGKSNNRSGVANLQKTITDKSANGLANIEKIIDPLKAIDNDVHQIQRIQDLADIENITKSIDKNHNVYMSDDDSAYTKDVIACDNDVIARDEVCVCDDLVMLEDPHNPRGCIYFQASVQVLRHSTAIAAGFQCSVHVGNVRQTAVVEAIMSGGGALRAGGAAPVLFRFARCPEYLVRGRRLLLTAGLGTRAIGRVTQTFPYFPGR